MLEFDLRRLGEVHPNTATVTNNLAFVLRDRGQYDEAERLYPIGARSRSPPVRSGASYIATVLDNLAAVLAAEGEHDEAERHFRESLAMFRRSTATTTGASAR